MAHNERRSNFGARDLNEAFKYERMDAEDGDEDFSSHKRRRPWKEDSRRQDRESKKQRQRNTEWED